MAVGKNNANVICNYELENGKIIQKPIGELIMHLLEDTLNRIRSPLYNIFPELAPYPMMASCRRYKRNVISFRSAIQQIMDDRRQGKKKSSLEDGDLLAILLQNELYLGDDEKTKDELTIFFLAGNETIKTSSTNTVCYLTQNPEIKAKFLDLIIPVLDKAAGNFIDKMKTDDVESFDYVRYCWNESMRLQPPVPGSSSNKF